VTVSTSFNLSFAAPTITVQDGANLLAQGAVTLKADTGADMDWGNSPWARDLESTATITVGAATIQGLDITIQASGTTKKFSEPSGGELDEDAVTNDTGHVVENLTNQLSVLGVTVFGAYVESSATSTVTIGAATLTAGRDVRVSANSVSSAQMKAF